MFPVIFRNESSLWLDLLRAVSPHDRRSLQPVFPARGFPWIRSLNCFMRKTQLIAQLNIGWSLGTFNSLIILIDKMFSEMQKYSNLNILKLPVYRLNIQTKPLDVVYNPSSVKRVREFFSTKKMSSSRLSQLKLTGKETEAHTLHDRRWDKVWGMSHTIKHHFICLWILSLRYAMLVRNIQRGYATWIKVVMNNAWLLSLQ